MNFNENENRKEVSYFAIIPARVRYDNDLSANAKLLYGEITALSNAEGYCWANNQNFASLYNTTVRTVQRWIKQLVDKEYIISEIIEDEITNEVIERRLYMNDICIKSNIHPHDKNVMTPHDKNVMTPHDKNVIYNNKSINNISKYVGMYEKTLNLTITNTLKNFIIKNEIENKMDLDLFEELILEMMNNSRVKRYDSYFKGVLTKLLNNGVRTVSDYEKYIEDFKAKKEAEKKTKAAKSKTKTEAKTQAVKTRFHNINERFRDYDPNELEKLLKQSQEGKFGDTGIHSSYLRAVKDGLASLSEPMQKIIIAYANDNNLEIPN